MSKAGKASKSKKGKSETIERKGEKKLLDKFLSIGKLGIGGRLLTRDVKVGRRGDEIQFSIFDPETGQSTFLVEGMFFFIGVDSTNIFLQMIETPAYEYEETPVPEEFLLSFDKFTGERKVLLTSEEFPNEPESVSFYPPTGKWHYIRNREEHVDTHQDFQDSLITHIFLVNIYHRLTIVEVSTGKKVLVELLEWQIVDVQPFAPEEKEGKSSEFTFLGRTITGEGGRIQTGGPAALGLAGQRPKLYIFRVNSDGEILSATRVEMLESNFASRLFPYSKNEVGVIWDDGVGAHAFILVNSKGKTRVPFPGVGGFGESEVHWVTPGGNVVETQNHIGGANFIVYPVAVHTEIQFGTSSQITALSGERFVGGKSEVSVWRITEDTIESKELEKLGFDIPDIESLDGSLVGVPFGGFNQAVLFKVQKVNVAESSGTRGGKRGVRRVLFDKYTLYALDPNNNFTKKDYSFEPMEFLRMDTPQWKHFVRCFLRVEMEKVPEVISDIVARFI